MLERVFASCRGPLPFLRPTSSGDRAVADVGCHAACSRVRGQGRQHRTLQRWATVWGITTDHFDLTRRGGSPRRDAPVARGDHGGNSTCRRGSSRAGCSQRVLSSACARSVARARSGTAGACRWCWTTSTAWPTTTGSRTCGSSVPIARRRLTPTASQPAARTDLSGCGQAFAPRHIGHRYCSQGAGAPFPASSSSAHPGRICARCNDPRISSSTRTSDDEHAGLGRRYGVSDNAVRKWIRWYERDSEGQGEQKRPEVHTIQGVTAPVVVILAAGQGTRMRSTVQKLLHPLCGRPIIEWPVAAARAAGAGRSWWSTGPSGGWSRRSAGR